MTEFLTTETQELDVDQAWFKQQSLVLMRQQLAAGIRYPYYPSERLTYANGARYPAELGRLYLPNGKWQALTNGDVPVTDDMIEYFYHKGYKLDYENRPLHPWIHELLEEDIGVVTGRGFYHNWGANETADPVIFRYDQAMPLILLVRRNDTHQWALPGGFVETDEADEEAALREAQEETLIELRDYNPSLTRVYKGPVADPRTTANAWAETTAYAIHLDPRLSRTLPTGLCAGNTEEVEAVGWFTIEEATQGLFGSHKLLVELALRT